MALASYFEISVGIVSVLIITYILFFVLEQTLFYQNTKALFASPNCQTNLQNSLGKVGSAMLCTLFKNFTLTLVIMIILALAIVILIAVRRIFSNAEDDIMSF
ncbi:MAG: hypothetical protein QXK74_07245 [Candidatus Nitrosocaldaceae archaeon]